MLSKCCWRNKRQWVPVCYPSPSFGIPIPWSVLQNRMPQSLVLFESAISSRWFLCILIILFLNKIDVFKSKLLKICLHRHLFIPNWHFCIDPYHTIVLVITRSPLRLRILGASSSILNHLTIHHRATSSLSFASMARQIPCHHSPSCWCIYIYKLCIPFTFTYHTAGSRSNYFPWMFQLFWQQVK